MTHPTKSLDQITAAQISRNFGLWQEKAMRAPIRVSHHGRPRVVILSAEAFERLAKSDARDGSDLDSALPAILGGMSEGFMALDCDLMITAANPVIEAYLGRSVSELIAAPVNTLDPEGLGDLLSERCRWVQQTGEKAILHAANFIKSGRAVCVTIFPLPAGVGMIFTNQTEITALRRDQGESRAKMIALDALGDILCSDLNILGFFTAANPALLRFTGFAQERLCEMRLADLAAGAHRQALIVGLNDLLNQKVETLTLEAQFLTRRQTRETLRLAIAPRIHNGACEGFAMTALAMHCPLS